MVSLRAHNLQLKLIVLLTAHRHRIIWQDSLLSISFDRVSSILSIDRHSPASNMPSGSYIECMYNLCQIGLEIVQERSRDMRSDGVIYITETQKRLEAINYGASGHLRDVKMIKSMKDHLEHWNFQMHRSYVTSELCRSVLTSSRKGPGAITSLRAVVLSNLLQTVNAFLSLQRINSFAKQSWAAVHRSLSSALLLCILGETKRVETTHQMISELVEVLSEMYSKLESAEVPTPISRSIAVLQKFTIVPDSEEGQPLDLGWDDAVNIADLSFSASRSLSSASTHGLSTESRASPYSKVNDILWGSNRELPLSSTTACP
jgi:hypothetical protein